MYVDMQTGNAETRKRGKTEMWKSANLKSVRNQKAKIAAFVYGFILDVEMRKR